MHAGKEENKASYIYVFHNYVQWIDRQPHQIKIDSLEMDR